MLVVFSDAVSSISGLKVAIIRGLMVDAIDAEGNLITTENLYQLCVLPCRQILEVTSLGHLLHIRQPGKSCVIQKSLMQESCPRAQKSNTEHFR